MVNEGKNSVEDSSQQHISDYDFQSEVRTVRPVLDVPVGTRGVILGKCEIGEDTHKKGRMYGIGVYELDEVYRMSDRDFALTGNVGEEFQGEVSWFFAIEDVVPV